jgi:hypothetical protein
MSNLISNVPFYYKRLASNKNLDRFHSKDSFFLFFLPLAMGEIQNPPKCYCTARKFGYYFIVEQPSLELRWKYERFHHQYFWDPISDAAKEMSSGILFTTSKSTWLFLEQHNNDITKETKKIETHFLPAISLVKPTFALYCMHT